MSLCISRQGAIKVRRTRPCATDGGCGWAFQSAEWLAGVVGVVVYPNLRWRHGRFRMRLPLRNFGAQARQ